MTLETLVSYEMPSSGEFIAFDKLVEGTSCYWDDTVLKYSDTDLVVNEDTIDSFKYFIFEG